MILLSIVLASSAAAAPTADGRHIENGREIPSEGYCDQPYVVLNQQGEWVCTLTTGPGNEGDGRQHVVSTISADQGRTWTPLADIEPWGPPEASWVMPLVTPEGRIYVFYVYNADNIREVLDSSGKLIRRVDTLGKFMMKYSNDGGHTWSAERCEVPIRAFDMDAANAYGGDVRFFWGVGKPIVDGGNAYMGLAKVGGFGEGFLEKTEGFFLKSANVLTEADPAKITWETLPDGTVGLRAPEGPIAEEHNLVALSDGALYCTYRTTQGHPCHAYSRDGGHTWSPPAYMTFAPDGHMLKHPRAANFVWKASNGKYLYWFHNHGGRSYADRNPAWICGGIEKDGHMYWSQPEILLYDDDPKLRMSYPCFFEDQGKYFITETQKTVARVHEIDPALLDAVWTQHERAAVATDGLVLETTGNLGQPTALPALDSPEGWNGLTLAFWLRMDDLVPGQTVLSMPAAPAPGIRVTTVENGAVQFEVSDGTNSMPVPSDPGLLTTGEWHHIALILDGGPKIATCVVDDRLCDGGDALPQGWVRLACDLASVKAGANAVEPGANLNGTVGPLRVYNRYLRTSEAIGNWRAGRE